MNMKIFQGSAKVILTVMLIYLRSISASCPSQKTSRRSQLNRLNHLIESDVVVEAKYMGELDDTHRFLVEQVWEKHHGNLRISSDVTIASLPTSISSCFKDLEVEGNYIIMAKPLGSDGSFMALEAPVSTKRRRHKQLIWGKLCVTPSGDESRCKMKVIMPERSVFYQGSMKLLQCRVQSRSPVREVTWYKDGTNIDTTKYRLAGLEVNKYDMENSFVLFREASHIHNGQYTCRVLNSEGTTSEGSTEILVLGPLIESHYTTCDDPNYCMNKGRCRSFIANPDQQLCECKSGYRGHRCDQIDTDSMTHLQPVGKPLDEATKQVSRLTTAVVLLACTLAGLLIAGIAYTSRLRKNRSVNLESMKRLDCLETSGGESVDERPRSDINYNGVVPVVNKTEEQERQSNSSSHCTVTSEQSTFEITYESRTPRSPSTASPSGVPLTPRSRLHANS